MNRMEEYQALMEELDRPVPALETTLDRAVKRQARRRHLVLRPLAGIAACFVIFVLLVNFCAPVAYACSLVPGLRELAEAVTFSRSLTDAVDHEYVQHISQSQTENDITASIEYLIVDQKQVNVFYRLNSDVYTELAADPEVDTVGDEDLGFSVGSSDFGTPLGELQSYNIDFVNDDVPDSLMLTMKVRDNSPKMDEPIAPENSGDYLLDERDHELEYVAEFQFLLEFDPEFTETGKYYPVDQTVMLDGQAITIVDMEVYPSHLRVNIEDSPENTAWLKDLDFYIETDWGMKFETVSNGITATGTIDSPTMTSYRADSSYFYEADHLKIVITGAEWLDKDMEKTYVNLKTGETGPLPEDVTLHSAKREGESWILEFKSPCRKENSMHQLFLSTYYDAEGTMYEINVWSSTFEDYTEDGEVTSFIERFPLKNYPHDEVWLSPAYSHRWTAEKQIVLTVQ